MKQELICTLCDNACPLSALGCLKGQRFYEQTEIPYCTLCENHCFLSALQCAKGIAFYGQPEKKPARIHQPKPANDLITLYEICIHQFRRVRGGLSSQIRILRFLSNHGSITQRELQNALCIKSAAMSELISKLEEQGLVIRIQSQKDKRMKVLQLTAKGEAAFAQQAAHEEDLGLFSTLSPEEQSALESILARLNRDWRAREEAQDIAMDSDA